MKKAIINKFGNVVGSVNVDKNIREITVANAVGWDFGYDANTPANCVLYKLSESKRNLKKLITDDDAFHTYAKKLDNVSPHFAGVFYTLEAD